MFYLSAMVNSVMHGQSTDEARSGSSVRSVSLNASSKARTAMVSPATKYSL